ncbi:pirin family protein [Achromobacter spanius]|uniref:pirin family protein n=1 Tax=Achromobacter spanius TaxID=217203 RepID=UPI00320835F5
MTLHLSAAVAGSIKSPGDSCTIRQFRHTDFSRGMSPLVMVDHFVMTGPAFGPHPHAGISAATLLLEDSTGAMQSLDSTEANREIRAGDLHWTLAGRGIVHAQRPAGEARLHGLQIFIDLPEHLKSLPASTSLLRAWEMPVIQTVSGRIRVAAGSYEGWVSPLQTPEPLLILDGWLRPGATTLVPTPPGWNAWFYAVQGDLGVRARHRRKGAVPLPKVAGGDPDFAILAAGTAATASATPDGEEGVLVLMAGKTPAHFVLIAGPAVDSPAAGRKTPAQDEHKALADALAAYETAEADTALQDAAA